jgi:hypothetical protein
MRIIPEQLLTLIRRFLFLWKGQGSPNLGITLLIENIPVEISELSQIVVHRFIV